MTETESAVKGSRLNCSLAYKLCDSRRVWTCFCNMSYVRCVPSMNRMASIWRLLYKNLESLFFFAALHLSNYQGVSSEIPYQVLS